MNRKIVFPEYFARRILLMVTSFILCFFSAISLQAFLKKQNVHEIVGNTLFFEHYDKSFFYFLFLSLFFFAWTLRFLYPHARFAPVWEKIMLFSHPLPSPSTWSLGKGFLCWIFFSLLLLFLTYPALSYGLAWDDLHLVRSYSSAELLFTFTGNWDVDGVENPGYRPFMTLWYAFLYHLFGEHFIYYRIFSALFIAFSYVLIIDLGRHFVRHYAIILAGLTLAAFSHTQSLYIGWITESFRSLQLFCAVGSLWALFRGLTPPSLTLPHKGGGDKKDPPSPCGRGLGGGVGKNISFIFVAFLLHTIGVFTREENSLLIIPICALLYLFLYKNRLIPPFEIRKFYALLALFVLPVLIYWRLRYIFVPATTYYYEFIPWGPVITFHATMSHYPFWGLPLYCFGAILCLSLQPLNRFFLFCLGLGIISCATSISGLARPDVSFYPVLWLSLAGGVGIHNMLTGTLAQKWLCIVFLLLIAVNGVSGNWMRMRSLNGMATHVIAGTAVFLYGEEDGRKARRSYGRGLSQTVTVPESRYRYYDQKYRKLGYKGGTTKAWTTSLEKQAEKLGRFSGDAKELPFKAPVSFFYYR